MRAAGINLVEDRARLTSRCARLDVGVDDDDVVEERRVWFSTSNRDVWTTIAHRRMPRRTARRSAAATDAPDE